MGIGSTRYLSDGTGLSTPTAYRYDAYGNLSAQAGPDQTSVKFAGAHGYESDGPMGFMLLGHRYYDPAVGRFLNPDPIGFAGGLNLYDYCGGNPVGFVDPSGLAPDPPKPGESRHSVIQRYALYYEANVQEYIKMIKIKELDYTDCGRFSYHCGKYSSLYYTDVLVRRQLAYVNRNSNKCMVGEIKRGDYGVRCKKWASKGVIRQRGGESLLGPASLGSEGGPPWQTESAG